MLVYLCFNSLALWFIFKDQSPWRTWFGWAFVLSLGLYLGQLFLGFKPFAPVQLGLELVLGLILALVVNTFSRTPFMAVLLLAGINGLAYYLQTPKAASALDPQAELLVQVQNPKQLEQLQEIVQGYQLQWQPAFQPQDAQGTELDNYYLVNIPDKNLSELERIVNALQSSGLVLDVEYNEQIQLSPLDQGSGVDEAPSKSLLNDPSLGKQWALRAIKAEEWWAQVQQTGLKPRKKVRIAIVDTGVEGPHEDLSDNYFSYKKEYDQDPHGHGTHCAGIAASVSNNGKGIASLFPAQGWVEVMSIQVFDASGFTSQHRVIKGMLAAADQGASVISMSLGGPSRDAAQKAYTQAVQYCNSKGAIVVVAAGNENHDARLTVPASVPGVIAVAAIDEKFRKASFSNTVEHLKMGIAAPGVNILSTLPNGQYGEFSGTSMATPYVASLLALLKAFRPELNTAQAYEIIERTALSTLDQQKIGKLIYPAKALNEVLD